MANATNYVLVFRDNNFNIVWGPAETTTSPIPPTNYPNNFPQTVSSQEAIFVFTVTVLLNLVQIKYQGKLESPFETHPRIMFVAIAGLILYYFFSSCDAKLRTCCTISTAADHGNDTTNKYYYFAKIGVCLCGSLPWASLLSVLVPDSLHLPVFTLSLFLSLSSQLLSPSIWDLLIGKTLKVMDIFRRQRPYHGIRRRRGGGIQVQLPV